MRFNICLIKPDGYIHSLAFKELAELVHFSLIELGHTSHIQLNRIENNCKNIIIGCHLLPPEYINQTPKSSIILNTEQVYADDTSWNKNIFEWVKNFECWDYSLRNIEKLKEIGSNHIKHFKIGYQSELSRIKKAQEPDIDILFYGSVNDRRQKILDELKSRNIKVHSVFGIYADQRDQLISRSKIVLNHHLYNSHIFEVVRVFYLLTNRVAVVGEVGAKTSIESDFLKGIKAAPYDELVTTCMDLLNNLPSRIELQDRAFQSISNRPQKIFMSELLS